MHSFMHVHCAVSNLDITIEKVFVKLPVIYEKNIDANVFFCIEFEKPEELNILKWQKCPRGIFLTV